MGVAHSTIILQVIRKVGVAHSTIILQVIRKVGVAHSTIILLAKVLLNRLKVRWAMPTLLLLIFALK